MALILAFFLQCKVNISNLKIEFDKQCNIQNIHRHSVLLDPRWNGHQLFVHFAASSSSSSLSSSSASSFCLLARSYLSQNPLGKSQKELTEMLKEENYKKEAKKDQEAGEQSSKELIGFIFYLSAKII